MKNKICHMTIVHGRYDNRIFKKECISLAEAGYKTYLLVGDNIEDEVISNVNILSIKKKYSSRIKRAIIGGYLLFKQACLLKADVYHIHDPELLPWALLLKFGGKKVIFDSHEFVAEQILIKEYIPLRLRKAIACVYRFAESYITKIIDGVIVPCTYNGRNYFEDKSKRCVLIDNLPVFETIEKVSIGVGKKLYDTCYVGSLTEARGILQMIRGVNQAGKSLVLAGIFDSEFEQKKIENMPEYEAVNYLGVLPQEDAMRVTKQSRIGLCLIQDVGQYRKLGNLPTKIYEYMALGIPVIASDFPSYKAVIEENICGMCVKPDDVFAVSNAIRYLIDNPDKLDEMGKNGQRIAKELYCWEKEKKKLVAFYDEILNV